MSTRLTVEHRRAMIVATAETMSANGGLYSWTLTDVADQIGITPPGVKYYFGSVQQLRGDIIRAAIKNEVVDIVVQAVVTRDPLADNIPGLLRQACADFIARGNG